MCHKKKKKHSRIQVLLCAPVSQSTSLFPWPDRPTDIHGPTTTKVGQLVLSQRKAQPQPSQLNRITCGQKSVCARQQASMWSHWIYAPATERPRATRIKLGLLHIVHWTWNWNCEIQALWENDVKRLQAGQVQLNMTQSSCVACSESHAEMAAEHTESRQDSSSFPPQSGETFHILKRVWRWGCCKGRLMRPPSSLYQSQSEALLRVPAAAAIAG